jgi:hypothetical protein
MIKFRNKDSEIFRNDFHLKIDLKKTKLRSSSNCFYQMVWTILILGPIYIDNQLVDAFLRTEIISVQKG